MILKKLLNLINLSKAQIFYIYEITKVIIIYKNENLVFLAIQVIKPNFKYFNNN